MAADTAPSPAYRDANWDQCAGEPETSVHLDHLPPDVRFDESTPEPIRFDPAKKELHYRGLMYSGSFSYLRNLSKSSNYLLAIDSLYMLSSQPKKQYHVGRWLLAATAVALAAAATVWKLWN